MRVGPQGHIGSTTQWGNHACQALPGVQGLGWDLGFRVQGLTLNPIPVGKPRMAGPAVYQGEDDEVADDLLLRRRPGAYPRPLFSSP